MNKRICAAFDLYESRDALLRHSVSAAHVKMTYQLEGQTFWGLYHRGEGISSSWEKSPSRLELLLDVYQVGVDVSLISPIAGIVLLKEGSSESLCQWSEALNSNWCEAVESIKQEGVIAETWFRHPYRGLTYLVALMIRSESHTIATRSELSVDKVHRDFKKSWDRNIRPNSEILNYAWRTP